MAEGRAWRRRGRWLARARLASGLVLAAFVVMHLANHALGLVSLDRMEAARWARVALWQSPIGTAALYGALATHLALGLRALYRRRTLRMARWEAVQLLLGLALPLLLLGHVAGTRLGQTLLGFEVGYPYVVAVLWGDGWLRVKQTLLVLVVWGHLAVGVHYWLRMRRGYRRVAPWLYPLAVLVPSLALLGFYRAGAEVEELLIYEPEARADLFAGWNAAPAEARAVVVGAVRWSPWVYAALVAGVLGARWARGARERAGRPIRLDHPEGPVPARPGQTVLEAIRAARRAHASVCGGRARCTTCRIRVGRGADRLAPPEALEAAALARIGAPPNVRLACQARPTADLVVTPLVPVGEGSAARYVPGGVQGHEQEVAILFVDLRESTRLNEARLPYDVVFILNQFFAEMSGALTATGGHYAQFAGDGLMALYGLREGPREACRRALRGAIEMERRVQRLNARLAGELPAPLRIGIGLHSGEAIVGTMGPPRSPNLSAIGDNVNVAARLEGLTKRLGCTLVVSAATTGTAGVDVSGLRRETVEVRGRDAPIEVFAVEPARALAARLEATAAVGRAG